MYAIRSYYAVLPVSLQIASGPTGLGVITSYSIHYTKLYDSKLQRDVPAMATTPSGVRGGSNSLSTNTSTIFISRHSSSASSGRAASRAQLATLA